MTREQVPWAEPGVASHVRTRGIRPIFNPGAATLKLRATRE